MIVNLDLIDHLYKVPKEVRQVVEWRNNADTTYEHFQMTAEVHTLDELLLRWHGWFRIKHGERRWGFKLEFQDRYEVRAWDMVPKHYSKIKKRYINGVGRHKHYYRDEDNARAVYGIPKGEISIEDPNEAVSDFADECNIRMRGGYQQRIFP